MGIFKDMGFCGNLDFFSAPAGEGEVVPEPEATIEEDYSDEELDVDKLERRMWRDQILLKWLREQTKGKEGADNAKGSANHRKKLGGRRCHVHKMES
ncbi:hypothetical protein ACLB2K_068591 [Fragaria x ananassa]